MTETNINIKDLLKEEAIEILNDIENYTSEKEYDPSKKLTCRLCKIVIEEPYLPFIIWNKNREYFCPLHFHCAIKPESVKIFNVMANNFDYIYEIDNKSAYGVINES